MNKIFPLICTILFLLSLAEKVTAQINQTVVNGDTTATVKFTGPGCTYNWVNNLPSIGLAASGTGNISSFTAINTGTSPVVATITATPVVTGYAYLANGGSNTISVVNTNTSTVISTIPVGMDPCDVILNSDGSRIYVSNNKSNTVSVIDAATNAVIATIPVGLSPFGKAITPDGTRIYVANNDNTVSVINTGTNTVVATIGTGAGAQGIIISPDGSRVYVANIISNTVSVINTLTNTVIGTIPGLSNPSGIAVSNDGTKIYVTGSSKNLIYVVDTTTYAIIASIPVGSLPGSIALSNDGTRLYVTNGFSNTVSVINTAANVVTTTIPVGQFPSGVSENADGSIIYVTSAAQNSLLAYNIATKALTATVQVGISPVSLGNFIKNSTCNSSPVTITITVDPPPPTILASSLTGSIYACAGTVSASPNIGQFSISGTNLKAAVTLTAPAGFELSFNAGSVYASTLTLPQSAGLVNKSIIFVRASATAVPGNLSGNISITSPGATAGTVAVTAKVSALPVAGFAVIGATCFGSKSAFHDASVISPGNSATSWLWDFGDGSTLAIQNPEHTYQSTGDYNVILTVTDNIGCTSVSSPTKIHIGSPPVANFISSAPDCLGQKITFTDKSSSADGAITKWVWNYGDGNTDSLISNQPVTHNYNTTGDIIVGLVVVTNNGCMSSVFSKRLTIHPLPIADFTLPDVCVDDSYSQFTDKSTISDNTQAAFTYFWSFGDANATAAANTSTQQNPRHKYIHEGNYNVTLSVTSASGCISSKSQTFTVNGANPVAAFTVDGRSNLCSSDLVTFNDASTVDFGKITRIVWCFDSQNHPTDTVSYTASTMPADKKYRHDYGLFSTPQQKSYLVTLTAYSGQTCRNVVQQTITINANPVVTLSPATSLSLCSSDQPLQFLASPNVTGTGVFSGIGVSSTGLFDPKVSGTGSFTINYLFTASTGCTYSTATQLTVNPVPKITIAPEFTILEGGKVTLNAKANLSTGTMTYKWSPSVGLSRDDVLNPDANPANSTAYTLTATSGNGCSTTTQVLVNVLKSLVIPNTFTPNGDGINDTWNIKYFDSYPDGTIQIFNRYGLQVYFSNRYPVPWDGRYKGTDLPIGTYYYIITPKSGRKPLSGYVSILR